MTPRRPPVSAFASAAPEVTVHFAHVPTSCDRRADGTMRRAAPPGATRGQRGADQRSRARARSPPAS